MTFLPLNRAATASILHAIWTRGPLSMEGVMEVAPELRPLEIVDSILRLNHAGVIDLDDTGVDPLYTELPGREREARELYVTLTGRRACRVCSCTDDWGCGECDWVETELCSACAGEDL
ncbi:hypothetical protein [Deinococcus sp. NW-56]|uniref:hypothetical protein n=1 Tax=Deinococcus sp. NW-56 TaxID=2080419 RepID=UPI000CF3D3C3|nr:hypothetical protein [Deinococcus sp. NW-56]